MKSSLQIIVACLALCLGFTFTGCTSSQVVGHDFDTSQVKNIVKGRTTAAQLVTMFGEPKRKFPVHPNQPDYVKDGERWLYTYANTTTKTSLSPGGAVAFLLLPTMLAPDPNMAFKKATTHTTPQKLLAILLDANKVVVSYRLEVGGKIVAR